MPSSIRRWCGLRARSTRSARRSRWRDAVSALVNLGYGQPQAAAAIAAAARSAGEGAETAQLIRLGLEGVGQ